MNSRQLVSCARRHCRPAHRIYSRASSTARIEIVRCNEPTVSFRNEKKLRQLELKWETSKHRVSFVIMPCYWRDSPSVRQKKKKKKKKKESELGQINIGQRGKISTLKRREVESRPNSCPIRHDRIERHIKSDLFRDYVNVCDTDTTPQLISCADALSERREIVLDLVSRGKSFEETSERVFCDLLFYDLGFPNALVYLLLTRSLTTNTMWIRVDRYF